MSESASLAWWSHSPACYHEPRVHDHELYFQLRDINVYVLLPSSVIGIVINIGALFFLYRPPKITSGVFVYLKAMLILDLCQLVISTCTVLIPLVCDLHHSDHHSLYGFCMIERRILKHTLPRFASTVNTMHVWTIAALSAHRYWKISRPVIARLKDTVCRAHYMLIVLFLVILLFRLPTFLLELELRFKPVIKIVKRIAATEMLSPYRFVYHTILEPVFGNIVPFMWMAFFSLLTLYEIYRSRNVAYTYVGYEYPKDHGLTQPLTSCFRKKAEAVRQKQELRATISIITIILLYLACHSLQLYTVVRKWQLLINHTCPSRSDYFHSQLAQILSSVSASVNAFVFIAFTNRLRKYVTALIRKTSRTLSNSSEPPLSPKTTITIDGQHHSQHHFVNL